MLNKIKIRKLKNGADLPLPKYETLGSSGMDLFAALNQKYFSSKIEHVFAV